MLGSEPVLDKGEGFTIFQVSNSMPLALEDIIVPWNDISSPVFVVI